MPTRKVTAHPERLTVTLDATEKEKLERLSVETDRSLAWHIREALRQYLTQAHAQSQPRQTG